MDTATRHRSGVLDCEGVRIGFDVYGYGKPTLLLLPAWAISHSGIWTAQIEHFASRYRVITYDPRGNGRSDRPTEPEAHAPLTLLGDAVAVLDEVGDERAVLVGNSYGTPLAFLMASLHPERVLGAVFIDPSSLNLDGSTDDPFQRALSTFSEDLGVDDGWRRFNRHSWNRDYEGFVRWFVEQALPEPHATTARQLGIGWGLSVTVEQLTATIIGRLGTPVSETAARLRTVGENIHCPTLVIHGELDPICPLSRSQTLARFLDAPLVVVEGAGHCPQMTTAKQVNPLLDEFLSCTTMRRSER